MHPSRKQIAYFARTLSRPHTDRDFGIWSTDRLSHIYIIGKTGTGKTTLLETLLTQDIENGAGLTLIDPHGDLVSRVARAVPTRRQEDLIYFDAADPTQPYGYNPLRRVAAPYRPLAAAGILETFKKSWSDSWGQRLEHILRNALLALMEVDGATLPDLLRLLSDKPYRRTIATSLNNQRVASFWLGEYEQFSPRLRAEAIVPIQNKVGAFLADPLMHRILVEPQQPIQIRRVMDEERLLLVNLSKGRLGDDSANLLGGLLVTTVGLAAYSRANVPEGDRRSHYLFVDEFQNFTTLAIANIISELRKYRVGLVLANQYLSQLEPQIRDAVLGNAGTLISFRIGGKDAPLIAREFAPKFGATDLIGLGNYEIYLRLMIDGEPSRPFSAVTLTPAKARSRRYRQSPE